MQQYFSTIKIIYLYAIMVSILLVAGGCGGGGETADTGGGDVTVQTGSLSKAQFVKRATQICEKNRRGFQAEYEDFVKAGPGSSSPSEQAEKLVQTILLPNFESDVEEISALGAPSGDEKEVTLFLNAIRQRLDEIEKRPTVLNQTPYPFARAAKMATAYGLNACAESFG
jgi:hypothetical protein